MRQISEFSLKNQRVLIRVDFNVPVDAGVIQDDTRIKAALPTIEHAIKQEACLILVSHLGRPKPDQNNEELTLKPVAQHLTQLLQLPVRLINDWQSGVEISPGEVVLLENIRFHAGETKNDPELAKQLGRLCDIYVNDAFGTAHRAHASTHGITKHVNPCCAGLLMGAEVDALERCLTNPVRPLVVVLGGAKVSGKLETLNNLKSIADTILIGGGIANTFLLANGYSVGNSLVEKDLVETALEIQAASNLPQVVDVMTTQSIQAENPAFLRLVDQIPDSETIIDIGPETARRWSRIIREAGTVIWNGPMGVDEYTQFGEGTRAVAEAMAEADGFTIAGGGDTLASISRYGVAESINYISTGGGAFLEYIEGKELPGVSVLE